MNKSAFFFHRSIPRKLFFINLLVCIVFILMTISVVLSFQYIEDEMTRIFKVQLDHISENSQVGRELARVAADSDLLVSTFFGREDFLKTEGENLIRRISALMEKTTNMQLKELLGKFRQKIEEVIKQCETVNLTYREMDALNQQIDTRLSQLGEVISQKILSLTMEGRDSSVIEQLTFMVSGYRETLPRLTIRFNRLGLKYFEAPVKKEGHPMLTLLNDLRLRLRTLSASDPDIAKYGELLRHDVRKYTDTVLQFHTVAGILRVSLDDMEAQTEVLLGMMKKLVQNVTKMGQEGTETLKKEISEGVTAVLLITSFMTLTVTILVFFLSRSVTQSLDRVIKGLQDTSRGIMAASSQVLSTSHQLAAGTSDQATSLEETSASLEEIDASIQKNADNTTYADQIVKGSLKGVRAANLSVSQLIESMNEISEASEEIRKIIKTIDEIAFRTNLLALNAAVEAARAGEAGAGFAVVADEVRNLAMQSAEASKNTAMIIKSTISKVQDGSEFVSMVNQTFASVEANSHKVSKLVGGVAVSSNQQAHGIGQVSQAVIKMDKVVQGNASKGEELAGTSEEMNARAEQMNEFVEELAVMAGKRRQSYAKRGYKPSEQEPNKKTASVPEKVSPQLENNNFMDKREQVRPDALIPLDDEDFDDF
ncbi:Methyl-accepting chemotaxis protein signailling domain-containing protein [Desulfonema magnum]|uniref:Methyl-accepting chemotaxis protein signailling domain-containing protein n=2 Tax=Desulfonema magnum TaxID=45655 RepID=A0A975BN54_9BACT|nr:Methyl-accepting chemotaxis protein signailling domain-containing protein [Desulfonema magnum]